MKKLVVFGGLLVVLVLAGCTKTQKQEYADVGPGGDDAFGTPLPPRQEGVSFLNDRVAKNRLAPVYFGFDRSDIPPSEMPKLQQVASVMKQEGKNVILAGFTDERGTEEYNRALGERRAEAMRNALIRLGASPARIQTVSFGLEMPADPGHNEAAWAKNRRVETGLVR
jgi:peptidoglycan-associated lipoprotein